jgi:hypothetical protein
MKYRLNCPKLGAAIISNEYENNNDNNNENTFYHGIVG